MVWWILLGIIIIAFLAEYGEATEIADEIGTDDMDDIEEIKHLLDEGDDDAIEKIREAGDVSAAHERQGEDEEYLGI